MHVFVTGGTGLVGRRIVQTLRDRGDEVTVLSRSTDASSKLAPGTQVVGGDPTTPGPWLDQLAAADGVIHLAGEPIAGGRWTAEFKQKVLDSRVKSTALIAETLAKAPAGKVLVSASAVGYYGMYRENATEFVEDDLPGTGFLADVCVAWERATEPAAAASVRVAIVRVGVVVAGEGGVLPQLARPFRFFVGGVVGRGRQWMSWIHIADIAGLFVHALDRPDAVGPINGTAPEPVTNWGFSHLLAKVLRRPCWMPIPAFGLRLLMGQMSELATDGQRVIPARAKALGYEFKYPLLEPALRQALGKGEPEDNP
jgi:uncharacterized protein